MRAFKYMERSAMKKIALLAAVLCSQPAWAADVKVDEAWMRATAPGQEVAGAFMNITSATDAKLTGVTSPAGTAQLHSMSMSNGVMEMRALKDIPLPKNEMVKLMPGGMHIMLFDLKHAVKPGDVVPVNLNIVSASGQHEKVEVKVLVRNLGGQ